MFWDIDLNRFDIERNKRLIIERTFTMGSKVELRFIIRYYGLAVVKNEIVKAGYLDGKTLTWVSLFLNIPKNKFKCYIKRPLMS
jgi:hypothetical protein